MKQDIICIIAAMLCFLPGELALATFGMQQQDQLTILNFVCWCGAFTTINFIIGGFLSCNINEGRKKARLEEEQQEDRKC